MIRKRIAAFDWQGHIVGEVAALLVVVVAGAGFAAWRASQRSETDLNARTWARLLPPKDPLDDSSEAQ